MHTRLTRGTLCVVLLLAGCSPSLWQQHQIQLDDATAAGNWSDATAEVRWQIDNAIRSAPEKERTPAAETARYLRLADLAARAGQTKVALTALREVLIRDPEQAPAVRAQIDRMPVSPAELARIKDEFAWNLAVVSPSDDTLLQEQRANRCDSYRVLEVRVHRPRTRQTPAGREREVTYDARSWLYDAGTRTWEPGGAWITNAGTELEGHGGTPNPRYRALTRARQQYYTDASVPPCQRAGWQGPYAPDGTVFVAPRLPDATP